MADVYVLASPAPSLFIYPSAQHPASPPVQPPASSGGSARLISRRIPTIPQPHRQRDDDETALAVLAAI